MNRQPHPLVEAVNKVIRSEYGYHPHQHEALRLAETFCRLADIASIELPFDPLEGSDHPALAYHIGWHPEPGPLRAQLEAALAEVSVTSRQVELATALAECAGTLWEADWRLWGELARQVMGRAAVLYRRSKRPKEATQCRNKITDWKVALIDHA